MVAVSKLKLAVIDKVSDSRFAQSTKKSKSNRTSSHGGTLVKHSLHKPKVKGLSPAAAYAATERERISKSLINKLTTF